MFYFKLQHIEKKVKMAKFDFSFGKDSANKEKNRFSEILPGKELIMYSCFRYRGKYEKH